MRLIHISDVHLGKRPDEERVWGKQREQEIWDSFHRLIRETVRQQADLLLIAGDLFDHRPAPEELIRANGILGSMECEVVMVAGSADYVREGSAFDLFKWAPNVHFLKSDEPDSVYLEKLDTTVHGLSYASAVRRDRILEDVFPDDEGEIQILVAYGGLPDACPFDLKRMQDAAFDYVALGGRHSSRFESPGNIAWPGSLEPLSPEETGKHGYIYGEIGANRSRFNFVTFAAREYVSLSVRISNDITPKELAGRLKEVMKDYGNQHIYRIRIEGKYQPGKPVDVDRLYRLGNVVKVEDLTLPGYDMGMLLENHRDDIVGMYLDEFLKQPVTRESQEALYVGLDALLQQSDENE